MMGDRGQMKWRDWFLAGGGVPLPRHLIIEITSCCNLRCRKCPKTHDVVNTHQDQIMDRHEFERLIPLLPHIESLDLNGVWGEAFLHPELYLRMLQTLKDNGVDVYTISNGTLITDELAHDLVAYDLNKLVVSLDAATAETYAKIRPPGRFEDLLQGMKSVAEWKRKLGSENPRIELAFVGMKTNIHEFPDAVRLAGELGAAQICLQAMGEYPGLEGESIAAHDKALGREVFAEAVTAGAEVGVDVILLPADQFEETRKEHNLLEDHAKHRKHCHDLWNRAVIAATGDVLPCCASPESLGNLREQSFAEIWRGEAYNQLRRGFLSGDLPEMCQHCTGTAWVQTSLKGDLQFYFGSLMVPRVKRSTKRSLKRYPAARWVKRQLDGLRAEPSS